MQKCCPLKQALLVYVGSSEFQQRDRYGRLPIRLLLFMLEKRQAELWEIIEAIWPEVDPETAPSRFHTIRSTFKKSLGDVDWCVYSEESRLYVVQPDFPHYYDAHDFNDTLDQFMKTDHPVQQMAQCLKLIKLYDRYAKTMEGDAFDDLRTYYDARYDQLMLHAQKLLPQMMDVVPKNWYETLTTQIRVRDF